MSGEIGRDKGGETGFDKGCEQRRDWMKQWERQEIIRWMGIE